MKNRARQQQNGFSLVELMAALTISLILLAGILQILLGNRQSMDVQRAEANLQDNARLAQFVTEHIIARAGYRLDPGEAAERAFPVNDGLGYSTGAVVSGNSHTLNVRFEANGDFSDCQNHPLGANAPETKSFTFSLDGGSLKCDNRPLTPDDSVAMFLVQYGIDTTGDNSVNTYANTPDGADVRSVRLQILLKSDGNVLPTPAKRSYELANGNVYTTSDNRLAYQMIDQTIALRNTLP